MVRAQCVGCWTLWVSARLRSWSAKSSSGLSHSAKKTSLKLASPAVLNLSTAWVEITEQSAARFGCRCSIHPLGWSSIAASSKIIWNPAPDTNPAKSTAAWVRCIARKNKIWPRWDVYEESWSMQVTWTVLSWMRIVKVAFPSCGCSTWVVSSFILTGILVGWTCP